MLWLKLGKERVALRQGETTLGRSHYCTVVIDSATASREHAAIRLTGDRVELTDLGSRNGTAVNGTKIAQPVQLQVGDIITIGSRQVQLVESELPDGTANTVEGDVPSDPRGSTATLPDGD